MANRQYTGVIESCDYPASDYPTGSQFYFCLPFSYVTLNKLFKVSVPSLFIPSKRDNDDASLQGVWWEWINIRNKFRTMIGT